MSIKSTMVGNTMIAYINNKMYQKVVNDDAEKLAIYEKAMNTNENNADEVAQLVDLFERKKSDNEIQMELEFERENKKVEAARSLLNWMEDIKENGDEHFEVQGIKLYMKGINITVPEFLAKEFCYRRDNQEDLTSLINFWKLCALNKDPRCREDLYKFLMNHDMVVTPSGYFLAYRNVAFKTGHHNNNVKELNDFISLQWTKTKEQKKSPKNYEILKLNRDDLEAGSLKPHYVRKSTGFWSNLVGYKDYELVGNLDDLYQKLSDNEIVYTDNHTRTMDIVIGKPVSIERSDCDANPDRTCSNGLHLGSPSFVTQGSFGQEGLICLCNPMNVVAVPYTGGEKLRCCEYLPIGIAEYDDDGNIIPIKTETFEYEYAEHTQDEIDEMVNTYRFESLIEHEIIPIELSKESLQFIHNTLAQNLEEMTEIVASRVEQV